MRYKAAFEKAIPDRPEQFLEKLEEHAQPEIWVDENTTRENDYHFFRECRIVTLPLEFSIL